MPIKLIRRPRAARRIHPVVQDHVHNAYVVLGKFAVDELERDVESWEGAKPEFKYEVKVTRKRWVLTLKYDRRTVGGRKYRWVDEGTGSYNPDTPTSEYVIKPRKEGGMLKYELPSLTKSLPASGIPSKSSQAPPGVVLRNSVIHPGIDPRNFSKDLKDLLSSRRSGSFHNVTEAAIKRAFRRLGIHT